jgi:hypothetical protein
MTDDLLRPDNHDLFDLVRVMLVSRDPVFSWEEISEQLGGVPVEELVQWFLDYRMPVTPALLSTLGSLPPRDPGLRAELVRLRRREASLVTVASEAPRQLATVQRRILSIERAH